MVKYVVSAVWFTDKSDYLSASEFFSKALNRTGFTVKTCSPQSTVHVE